MRIISNKVIAVGCAAILTFAVSAGRLYSQDFNSALKFLQSERYEDAANAFKLVTEKEPNNGDAFFYYGETILKNYQTDPLSNSLPETVNAASGLFSKGVKADSLNGLNYVGLGMVILLEKGDTIAADKYFKKAELTLPKKKKNYTERNFNTLIELGLSELYAKNSRYNKAIAYLNKAIEFAPNNTDAYIALGDVYLDQNKASEAVTQYNKAVYINPKLAEPLVKTGNLYMRSRNLNQARENFEKAKEIDSTYAPLYKGLGEMFSLGGQPKFATINYKKYFALSGNNIPAQKQLVNALFKAKVYDEVISNVDEIMAVDKSSNYLNRVAAYSCYEKKPADYQKARKYIETFFANTTPEKIITKDYSYYGRILLRLRDTSVVDKAFDKLITAYKLDTTDCELVSDIAVGAYFTKHYKISVDFYNKKINGCKNSTNDYMYLGKAYYQWATSEKSDTVARIALYHNAENTFAKVTSKEPDNLQAYLLIANTNASLDPDSKQGLAKPKYDILIEKAISDTVKNVKELFESYSFMASYYFGNKDYNNAIPFAQKIVNLDPKNTASLIKGYTFLALSYQFKKDYPKALTYYKKVSALNPKDEAVLKTIKALQQNIAAQQEQ